MNIIYYILVAILIINISLLFIYACNLLFLFFLALRSKNNSYKPANEIDIEDYPYVTVQIPVFNEKYVIERVIRNAAEIKYPQSKLEIQILDDSTDVTLDISKEIIAELKNKGLDISLIHRKIRTGFKAGALKNALKTARGEYTAVFDADFIPNPDMLYDIIPFFLKDNNLGMVQTRWGHINHNYSLLTRAQAMGIDGHFSIEQVARYENNFFMNFNGTAGIWRKECIIDSGNWQADTLTEDLDLSFRARLRGWKFKYMKNIVNNAEIPVQLKAFKSQQFRWAKGSIQTAKKQLKNIFSSKRSFLTKFQAFIHLTYYSVHPLLLINIIFTVPLLLCSSFISLENPLIRYLATLFSLGALVPVISFLYSQIAFYYDWRERIKYIPIAMLVGTGMAVNNSFAVLEAIFGKKSDFIRTPKFGMLNKDENWKQKTYKSKNNFTLTQWLELFFGMYSFLGLIISIINGHHFTVPFFLLYSSAFFYIFLIGVVQNQKFRKSKIAKQRI